DLLLRASERQAHGVTTRRVRGDGTEDRVCFELPPGCLHAIAAHHGRRNVGNGIDALAALPGGEIRLQRPLGDIRSWDEILVPLRARENGREGAEGRDRGESEDSGDQHAPPVHLPVPERPLYIESRNTCTGSMPNTTYLASCGGPLSVAIRTVKTRP